MLCSLLVVTSAMAAAGIDVVFLPEAPDAPSVVVTVDNSGNNGKRRMMAWALLPPAQPAGTATSSFGGDLADDQGTRSALSPLPQAPRGAGLVERDGALSFTIDEGGEWERAWAHLVPSKGAGALPVPGPKGLRLVVHGAVDSGPSSAVLYGNKVRVAGTAVVRSSSGSPSQGEARGVVTSAGIAPGVKPALFLEANGTTIDRVAACKREAPSAISVVTSSLAMKLYAKGTIACAGTLAIVPVEGVKLDAKKDVPVRGVVVAR